MEGKPEHRMRHQRKEPVAAVTGPLDADGSGLAADLGLGQRPMLPDGPDDQALPLEYRTIGTPRMVDSRFRVVEEIDVTGEPCPRGDLVERAAASHVALARGDARVG
jgi:hypothetical protein